MKRLLNCFFYTLTACGCFAQIEMQPPPKESTKSTVISEVNNLGLFIARLSFYVQDSDTTYHIFFNNLGSTRPESSSSLFFKSSGNSLDTLSAIFLRAIDADKGSEVRFKLGKQDLLVTTQKALGVKGIRISLIGEGTYFDLNRKQIGRLFNKKDS